MPQGTRNDTRGAGAYLERLLTLPQGRRGNWHGYGYVLRADGSVLWARPSRNMLAPNPAPARPTGRAYRARTVAFGASLETRTYAIADAPARVRRIIDKGDAGERGRTRAFVARRGIASPLGGGAFGAPVPPCPDGAHKRERGATPCPRSPEHVGCEHARAPLTLTSETRARLACLSREGHAPGCPDARP